MFWGVVAYPCVIKSEENQGVFTFANFACFLRWGASWGRDWGSKLIAKLNVEIAMMQLM